MKTGLLIFVTSTICLLASWVQSQTTEVLFTATGGFANVDNAPILAGGGSYVVQYIWSQASTNGVDLTHPQWRARPGGGINTAVHTELGRQIFTWPEGNAETEWGNPDPFEDMPVALSHAVSSGYFFVRVFGKGSQDANNLAAFDYYYEGPLYDLSAEAGSIFYDVPEGVGVRPPGEVGSGAQRLALEAEDPPPPGAPDLQNIEVASMHGFTTSLQAEAAWMRYELQFTTNLLLGATGWQSVPGAEAISMSPNQMLTLTDPNQEDPTRIYRVVVWP